MCRSIRIDGSVRYLRFDLCSGDGIIARGAYAARVLDTVVLDLTEQLSDPVEVLFGIQLGGGTDINQAVSYCANKIQQPRKSHLILITDLCEGGNADELVARLGKLVGDGVNVIVLLALSDEGKPYYNPELASTVAAMGIAVFACTPDQFPDLMATALRRQDIFQWAAKEDLKLIAPETAAK